jgi:hypothetical protein
MSLRNAYLRYLRGEKYVSLADDDYNDHGETPWITMENLINRYKKEQMKKDLRCKQWKKY